MRKLIIVSLLTICLLVLIQGTFAEATTFTREFRDMEQSFSSTNKMFSFSVIATIQTEPDGSWFIGNTYQVNYTIQLTYVNETLYNNFTMSCFDSNAIQYQTDATLQNNGTLTFNITAESGMGSYGIDQAFSIAVFDNRHTITNGSWFPSMQDQPIHVDVVNKPITTPSNLSGLVIDPLYVVMICLFLIAIGAVAILAYKMGRKNPPK